MEEKTFLKIAVILMAVILFWDFLAYSGAMNPFSKDYQLTGTNVNIVLAQDGTTAVNEAIGYMFKGCYTEVFRNTNIPSQPVNSPYITKISASCEPSCTVHNRGYEIAGDFGSICDSRAEFLVNFDAAKGIEIGSDIAEFHYKIWGENWGKPLNALNGEILLPVPPSAVYFNPMGIAHWKLEGNTLKFSTGKFEGYLEVRLLMPKGAFTGGQNFITNPDLTKDSVMKIQSDYAEKYYLITLLMILLYAAIFITLTIVPYLLYKKYGTEPKISYDAIFEREPVKGMKPYIINSLCSMKTGDTDNNAITATLLDLVRRGHIELKEMKKKTLFGMKSDISLVFKGNPKDALSTPEKIIYGYFSKSAKSGELVWSAFLTEIGSRQKAQDYLKMSEDFEKAVDTEYNPRKYFSSKGDTILKTLSVIMIVLGILLLNVSTLSMNYLILSYIKYLAPFMIALPVLGLLLPRRVFGRFIEGYEIYKRSMNYKKFLTNMTLLRKYPPASIVIWEQHLVYATLFGVAEKVIKEMKLVVNENFAKSSRMYPIYNTAIISSFNSARAAAASTITGSGHSGGFSGGVGGGFGGGGGGAR